MECGNGQRLIADLLVGHRLRANGFIITVYGDVAEPRGGRLWMATLIEICGSVGISETLLRTAVSRLVAAGRLEGARVGRRSSYRLTEAARREFAEAAARGACGGLYRLLRPLRAAARRLEGGNIARGRNQPRRGAPARSPLPHGGTRRPASSPDTLGPEWPSEQARALFAEPYRHLSPAADAFVTQTFSAVDCPLPAETEATHRRMLALVCRFRVAAPTAAMGLPDVTLGLVPGAGGIVRLPRFVPPAAAVEMVTSGR